MPIDGTWSARAPRVVACWSRAGSPPRFPAPRSVENVAVEAVRMLHESFDYYLAVVQRLDPDGLAAGRRGGPGR